MEVNELKAALSNTGIFRHCFRAETEIWRAETERLDTYPAFRITRGIRSLYIWELKPLLFFNRFSIFSSFTFRCPAAR